ncbi:hypothetical protein DERP_012611 [Dermatophagoides pteronyssinus]|uniref:Uncharacterized protein n=1 Tax=Dermatophagoides pteronyssinus TaxID=6956 RepID=A0ABQ8IV95_DERPT|nr:hypothetical protein DERP_012611 [Dermatophagoides pteronyssinus]
MVQLTASSSNNNVEHFIEVLFATNSPLFHQPFNTFYGWNQYSNMIEKSEHIDYNVNSNNNNSNTFESLFSDYVHNIDYNNMVDNLNNQENGADGDENQSLQSSSENLLKNNGYISLPMDANLLVPLGKSSESLSTFDQKQPISIIKPMFHRIRQPQRRFLMLPFRRLMLAYIAPRILRFQMSMLVSSLIGELSRKIIDPFLNLSSFVPNQSGSISTTNGGNQANLNNAEAKLLTKPSTMITIDQLKQIQHLASIMQPQETNARTIIVNSDKINEHHPIRMMRTIKAADSIKNKPTKLYDHSIPLASNLLSKTNRIPRKITKLSRIQLNNDESHSISNRNKNKKKKQNKQQDFVDQNQNEKDYYHYKNDNSIQSFDNNPHNLDQYKTNNNVDDDDDDDNNDKNNNDEYENENMIKRTKRRILRSYSIIHGSKMPTKHKIIPSS